MTTDTGLARPPSWVWLIPIVLAALAAVLLLLAHQTPPYSDAAAFEAETGRIEAIADFDARSEALHAARHRFETAKWVFADMGYTAAAWSTLLALVIWRMRSDGWTVITHSRRSWKLPVLLVVALALLFEGVIDSGLQAMARNQVPYWADSFGIFLRGVTFAMLVITPPLALLTLVGLARRAPAFPLIAKPRPPYWPTALVTLLYLPLVALSVMAAIDVASTGSWGTSTAGGLIAWLLLNARAQLIAPPAPEA